MQDKRRYSSAEGAKILEQAAAKEDSPSGHTWRELEDAAASVGIDPERLQRAEAQLALKQRRFWMRLVSVGAVSALAVALLLAFQNPGQAGRAGHLLVHNEQRTRPVTVGVMLPKAAQACSTFWAGDATDFCRWRQVQLKPGERRIFELPEAHAQCGRVRLSFSGPRRHLAVVDSPLPAALEIERDGSIDQKGIGQSKLQNQANTMEVDEPCSI